VLRLESIGFVLLSAMAMLVVAFLVVLGPLLFSAAAAYVPALAPLESHYDFARFGVSSVVLAVSLFILHMWLPAGRRGFGAVWPGILATVRLSLDEQCHVCVEEGLSASVIPYLPLCVFVPHATS
jgi:membrane protein